MKKLLMLAAAALLDGCMNVTKTEGTKIDKAKVLEIKAGSTTRQAVITSFGTPTEVSYENNEEKMTYRFKEKKVPAYMGGMVENESKSRESVTVLELVFRDNVVWSYRYKSSEN
ncbi:MAG: hypothetical protein HS130_12295 [Deltaproteobacteria bacterium]|nr:hypothetical protein [Deltaproteobacteria bacterium]